jgi:hypothetical protein
VDSRRLVLALAGFQAADAVACAIPLAFIKKDLDRLGCPESLQHVLPFVKGAAAAGLVVGTKAPRVGAVTSAALMGYFACAIGFHIRAGDPPIRSAPAAALGIAAALAFREMRRQA